MLPAKDKEPPFRYLTGKVRVHYKFSTANCVLNSTILPRCPPPPDNATHHSGVNLPCFQSVNVQRCFEHVSAKLHGNHTLTPVLAPQAKAQHIMWFVQKHASYKFDLPEDPHLSREMCAAAHVCTRDGFDVRVDSACASNVLSVCFGVFDNIIVAAGTCSS